MKIDQPIDELSETNIDIFCVSCASQVVFVVQPFKSLICRTEIHMELLEIILKRELQWSFGGESGGFTILGDRLIRIDKDSHIEEYLQKDFSSIPIKLPPWYTSIRSKIIILMRLIRN